MYKSVNFETEDPAATSEVIRQAKCDVDAKYQAFKSSPRSDHDLLYRHLWLSDTQKAYTLDVPLD